MSMMTFFRMVSEEACAFAGSLLTRCQRSPWRGSAFLISSSTWESDLVTTSTRIGLES